ncbi:MAG: hypothetical protein J0M12_17055, partial [Deltaproteobacteria bacterium]|nr:hypothetical protein [Deltaproteobacteria bacterium]
RKRTAYGSSIIGKNRLLNQRLETNHQSKRAGKRTFCLSENRKKRIQFIKFFRRLMDEARRISRNWLLGDFSERYPMGLYPPSLPKLAEPLTAW